MIVIQDSFNEGEKPTTAELNWRTMSTAELDEYIGLGLDGALNEQIKRANKAAKDKAVDADLTKAHRERIDLALATLEALPDCADKPGHLDVPWPQTIRPKVADEQWAKADLGHVHIQDLTATQPYLKRETVVYHIMSPGSPGEHKRAFANVVRQDGKELIYDGHHRLAALWLLGAEVSNTWILE